MKIGILSAALFCLFAIQKISCQTRMMFECPTEGAEIRTSNGLRVDDDGYYHLQSRYSYFMYAEKAGCRSETTIITPDVQKKWNKQTFAIPPLKRNPDKSADSIYLDVRDVNWDEGVKDYEKRVYNDMLSDQRKVLFQVKLPLKDFKSNDSPIVDCLKTQLSKMGMIDSTDMEMNDKIKKYKLDVAVRDVTIEKAEYDFEDHTMEVSKLKGTFTFELYDYFGVNFYSKSIDAESCFSLHLGAHGLLLDAVEAATLTFIDSDELKNTIIKRDVDLTNQMQSPILMLPKTQGEVQSISQATKASVVLITPDGHSSASIISDDGYIVSSYRVLGTDSTVKVILSKGDTVEAKVIRADWKYDLVLLKAEMKGEKFVRVNPDSGIDVGDPVYALGISGDVSLGQSISRGILSANRNFYGHDYYQTDAKLNVGNCGGGLVNDKGELVGVICSKIVGFGIEGLGFAIPAKYIFERLRISYP